jgi:hypothetical protein
MCGLKHPAAPALVCHWPSESLSLLRTWRIRSASSHILWPPISAAPLRPGLVVTLTWLRFQLW